MPYLAKALPILILFSSYAGASEVLPTGLYQITTEIGMPHLDENLRYATMREKQCLDHQELSSLFPILHHNAFTGCKLDQEYRHGKTVSYVLICEEAHGMSGGAQWQLGGAEIHGTLEVKLGGKNMTLYQRVTAKLLSECVTETR